MRVKRKLHVVKTKKNKQKKLMARIELNPEAGTFVSNAKIDHKRVPRAGPL